MAPSSQRQSRSLTTARGAALYTGALLGPGLLLLPGLAAAQAGPASILAWLALLGLSGLFAAVFSALGRRYPSAGGVMQYVAAGLGARAGLAAGWSFLAAVVTGAPLVCLIGASYVTELTGGGQLARAAVAAMLLLIVLGLAAGGLRASASAQLVLVSLLIGVIAVAIAGSGASARAAHWTPFAPHGWLSIGHAAATLMLSFVGWEAVAPLTTRFANPSRQLPRVIGIALAATTVLYLGLAITTISVLGPAAASTVPLVDLLRLAIGPAGTIAAAAAAVVLTLGTTNAYVTGAAAMARQLTRSPATGHDQGPAPRFLAAIAAAGLLLITLYGLRLISTASLVARSMIVSFGASIRSRRWPPSSVVPIQQARRAVTVSTRPSSSCWRTAAGRRHPHIVALAVIRHHQVRHDDSIPEPGEAARPAAQSFRQSLVRKICRGCG
jgi:amino acid efflux transporter